MTRRRKTILTAAGVTACVIAVWLIFGNKAVPPDREDRFVILVIGTDNPKRLADVVFVHGLGGDGHETWHPDQQPDKFWPKWIGEKERELGVWSVHYDASPARWGQTMPLSDRAGNILNRLDNRDIGTERSVIFVAHSLGGLVVKEMLHQAVELNNPRWKKIARNTKGIAFLATPHAGSGLADFMEALFRSLTSESIRDLEASAVMLRQLNQWYRGYAPKNGIATLVLFEKYKLRGTLIVNEASADPGINDVIPIAVDANHVTICKPPSEKNDVFISVLRFIRECADPPGDIEDWQPVNLSSGEPPANLECARTNNRLFRMSSSPSEAAIAPTARHRQDILSPGRECHERDRSCGITHETRSGGRVSANPLTSDRWKP